MAAANDFGFGWLAGVLPADARRFRVSDAALAAALADAGGKVVEDAPDVEIASPGELRGDAAVGLVTITRPPGAGHQARAVRAAVRAGGAVRTRLGAERARRGLRRRGYGRVDVIGWDFAHGARLPGFPGPRARLAERLPQRALAVGQRGTADRTALQAALAAAEEAAGTALVPEWASVRSGVVVVVADRGVLRAAVGPARVQLDGQASALDALHAEGVPAAVAERAPRVLARGRAGLVDWTLERRLPGSRPGAPLAPALLDECVDFLVALHGAGGGEAGEGPAAHADTVATVCTAAEEASLRALAARLEDELAGLPRGFVHGDFFAGNLLAEGDRLTAVLDWDAAAPGRLPATDLFHLELTAAPYGRDSDWGRAVLERVLPAARAGGSDTLRRYCDRLGLESSPAVLEQLAVAYWLGYAAYQLRTHAHRYGEPAWIAGNVRRVLADPAIRRVASAPGRGAPTRAA